MDKREELVIYIFTERCGVHLYTWPSFFGGMVSGYSRKKFLQRKDVKFPTRKFDAKKGDNGRLLIIGGSEDFVGALVLASLAAFRGSVDLVEVAAPEKVAWAVNQYDPSIISHKLPGKTLSVKHIPALLSLAKPCNAVLLGNGMCKSATTSAFVKAFLKKLDKPVVIDADALHSVVFKQVRSKVLVCTPHAKEFAVLCANNKVKTQEEMQKMLPEGFVILKKGVQDKIFSNKQVFTNKSGVPEMAVAGTGDILAGLTAAFLAQGLTSMQAACSSAFFNGLAGQRAQKDFGNFSANEMLFYVKP